MSSDSLGFSTQPLDCVIRKRNQGVNTTTEKVTYSSSGIPVIRSKNIKNNRIEFSDVVYVDENTYSRLNSSCKPEEGDVLFTNIGDIGNAALVAGEQCFIIAWNVLRLQPSNNVNARYLCYVLSDESVRKKMLSLNSSSTLPFVSGKEFGKVEIPLPDLDCQASIVNLLKPLDDRITLLRETNATLEAIAKALFKSWFVDFDPVRAKAEGRQPEGMDAATAALFPDSFEESELGLVPKGWKLVPFGELLTHTIGGDWGDEAPSEKNDTRVAIIRGTDIPDLQSGTASRVPVRYTSSKKLATRKLQDGDLVLEVSGGSKDQPTGRALYLTAPLLEQFDCPVEPASFCRLLRPLDMNVGVLLEQHLSYIYSIGKTWAYQNQSTGIANFQTTHFLENELVAMPSAEILSAFAAIVRPMIDRSHLSQIRDLTQLRDTLLPRLISGQLRLPEAEALVEEMPA